MESLEERSLLSVTFTPTEYTYSPSSTVPVQFDMQQVDFIEVADLNGDHLEDIMTINSQTSKLLVYLNNGQTTDSFGDAPLEMNTVGLSGKELVVEDVNGDQTPDLVAMAQDIGKLRVSTFLGVGDGTFDLNHPVDSELGLGSLFDPEDADDVDASFEFVTIDDFDGDGKADLLSHVSGLPITPPFSIIDVNAIYSGNGDGTFGTTPREPVGMNGNIAGTGEAFGYEVVTTLNVSNDFLRFYSVNSLNMNSTILGTYSLSASAGSWGSVNLDSDDDTEVYYGTTQSINDELVYEFSVIDWLGVNQSGQMQADEQTYTLELEPRFLSAGDLNNDDLTDFLISDGDSYQILLGKSDGTYEPQESVVSSMNFHSTARGDFDDDGLTDTLAVGDRFVTLLPGDSTKDASIVLQFDELVQSASFGDFDGDGRLDLVVTKGVANSDIAVFHNVSDEGTDTFALSSELVINNLVHLEVGNFDNQHGDDLAVLRTKESNTLDVVVFRSLSDGTFDGTFVQSDFIGDAIDLVAGDLNNDGYDDLVTVNEKSASVSILINNQAAAFTQNTTNPTYSVGNSVADAPSNPSLTCCVALGDLDNDGYLDLAAANYGDGDLVVLMNDGASDPAAFGNATAYHIGGTPRMVAIGDFNVDGLKDVAGGMTNNDTIAILLNSQDNPGSLFPSPDFTDPITFDNGDHYNIGYVVELMDDNGSADIIVANGNTIVTLLNDNHDGSILGSIEVVIRDHDSALVSEVNSPEELDDLLDWVDEWSQFWVEIWATSGDPGAGITGFSCDLQFNENYFAVQEIVPDSAFDDFGNLTPLIENGVLSLDGFTSLTSRGDGEYALLARVAFEPVSNDGQMVNGEETVGVDLDIGTKAYPTPVANDFTMLDTTTVELSNNRNGGTIVASPDGVNLFPVMYDINDDGQVNAGDFSYFLAAFVGLEQGSLPVTDSLAPAYAMITDFNHDNYITAGDFSYFLATFVNNSGRDNPDAAPSYASNFPDDWIPQQSQGMMMQNQTASLSDAAISQMYLLGEANSEGNEAESDQDSLEDLLMTGAME